MRDFIPLMAVRITDPFWRREQRLVREAVLPHQWEILNDRVEGTEPSHCVRNFRIAAGELQGKRDGTVFLDSDLYKWLEAVAYCLATERDDALEALADGAVELIGKAQQPDGYLDTYFTLEAPTERWQNLMEGHELYCAGHFIEAAVAYAQATGKEKCLEIARRLVAHIDRTFGCGAGKLRGYPGHPEIELALVKMYRHTGDESCLRLARYFVDVRGAAAENWFEMEENRPGHRYIWPEMEHFGLSYFQAERPVRRQTEPVGHAVRAMYLYSAMADLALLQNDGELQSACQVIFDNLLRRRMYVTGGIGSAACGERFTTDFDLPNHSAYCETCASVGLMLYARRMFLLTGDLGAYDPWERALCNTVLAGMGRDGKHFFYVNPLETNPDAIAHDPSLEHVQPSRQKWFGVACCPPNIARTISALGGSLYALEEGRLWVLEHIPSAFQYGGMTGSLSEKDGEYTLEMDGPAVEIILRRPEGFRLEGGDVIAHQKGKAVYHYRLIPEIRTLRTDPRVSADAGKLCVMRGATVYCLEEKDNGPALCGLYLDAKQPIRESAMEFLPDGMPALAASGYRRLPAGKLYSEEPPVYEPVSLIMIPYSQWNNRGQGEMRVWINEYPGS